MHASEIFPLLNSVVMTATSPEDGSAENAAELPQEPWMDPAFARRSKVVQASGSPHVPISFYPGDVRRRLLEEETRKSVRGPAPGDPLLDRVATSHWELYHTAVELSEGTSTSTVAYNFRDRMMQILIQTGMHTLNSGAMRGWVTFTHDLRDSGQARLTVSSTTNMFYPLIQSSLETFVVDSRLLQLKTTLLGRPRMRLGYGWGGEEYEAQDVVEEKNAGRETNQVDQKLFRDKGSSQEAGDLHNANVQPPGEKRRIGGGAIGPPPPASALWTEAGINGRPVGVILEGPASSDSFVFAAWFFGPEFKRADRVPPVPSAPGETPGGKINEEYLYGEHTLFCPAKGGGSQVSPFADYNLPVPPGREVAFHPPMGERFVDQVDRCKGDFGPPLIVLRRWYRRVDEKNGFGAGGGGRGLHFSWNGSLRCLRGLIVLIALLLPAWVMRE